MSILLWLFPSLRSKLIWNQAFRYLEVIRNVQESLDTLVAKDGSANVMARSSLQYTHHMPFSFVRTRTRFLYIKCIVKK